MFHSPKPIPPPKDYHFLIYGIAKAKDNQNPPPIFNAYLHVIDDFMNFLTLSLHHLNAVDAEFS